jgi:leucine dehydrogenase
VACESSPALGDISEHTAIGVWHAMRACLESAGLAGRRARVAIQGVGSVGMHLARILRREGMELVIADINSALAAQAQREFGARVLPPEEILSMDCDVLAPCALGGVLKSSSIHQLRARIVCGSANNQLATAEDGDELARRQILYAPDYLANAGGLIRGAEFYLLNVKDSLPSLARIGERMKQVIELAVEKRISTARAADEMAEARLKRGKRFGELSWGASPAAPRSACQDAGGEKA